MLDLLSGDIEVFEDFLSRAQHTPPVRRLPVVLWSRLRLDLEPYLAERLAGGKLLLRFFHRIIEETIAGDLSQDTVLARHNALARYFESLPLYISCEGQTSPNLRKLGEQVFQQAAASRWEALAESLGDPHFLEARIRHPDGARFGVHELIDDCTRGTTLRMSCGCASPRSSVRWLKRLRCCGAFPISPFRRSTMLWWVNRSRRG